MSTSANPTLALAGAATLAWLAAPAPAQTIRTTAHSEQFFDGELVDGNLASTYADDGDCEVFRELARGNTSKFSHLYELNLPEGLSHTLHLEAFLTDSGEGDDLMVRWSIDDDTYTWLFDYTVADSGSVHSAPLPAEISGTLLIWVQDTNRRKGNTALDTFSIDWLCVETVPIGGTQKPPLAPTNLAAGAASAETIALTWEDNSIDEDGFRIERAPEGGTFATLVEVPADATAWSDSGLASESTWYYRVLAFNAAGDSDPSNAASATTWPPTTFTFELVQADAGSPLYSYQVNIALAADTAGRPVLCYWNQGTVEVSREDPVSGWTFETLTTNDVGGWQLAVSDLGTIGCTYTWRTGTVELAEDTGAGWPPQGEVVGDLSNWFDTSLAYDSAGNPAVAYFKYKNRNNTGIVFATRSASGWQTEILDSPYPFVSGGAPVMLPQVVFDSADRPIVAWQAADQDFTIAQRNGSTWDLQGVPELNDADALAYDPVADSPVFLIEDPAADSLSVARRVGDQWTSQLVVADHAILNGGYGGFTCDEQGQVHIVYVDWSSVPAAIVYATDDTGAWRFEPICAWPDSAMSLRSLRVDGGGEPMFAMRIRVDGVPSIFLARR